MEYTKDPSSVGKRPETHFGVRDGNVAPKG
jgi:hypothetical protein